MKTAILWFRRDLRLADNPALTAALQRCERVVPVYLHAPQENGGWADGAASRWFLHHALASLTADLGQRGSGLLIRRGPTLTALRELVGETGAEAVYWNRLYEPALIERDTAIKQALREAGVEAESSSAALLIEPWALTTGRDEPYRVFTPFWRAALGTGWSKSLRPAPAALPPLPPALASEPLDDLSLQPRIAWDTGLAETWTVSEAAAHERLRDFCETDLAQYTERRDRPAVTGTSRLSPYLHFGLLGARQVAATVEQAAASNPRPGLQANAEHLLRELGWREFAHHLLFHFPHTPDHPLDPRFEAFPWRESSEADLAAWQQGRTGIPMVDAGMRELWHTGWMHNRVRMLVASFLTKNLLIPWQSGARWFWDTLVDADLANNTLGWQWTAGCGADAAPYFRIFNPVLQGERFDPAGAYVRRWVPELARLAPEYIHQPWAAPPRLLAEAGIRLGIDYPTPIVDLKASRSEALARFEQIKAASRGASPRTRGGRHHSVP